jgi:hypothetical protein
MTQELRTTAEVSAWLSAGLQLRRSATSDARDDGELVARALIACASELASLPPPGVVADVAVMLAGARPSSLPLTADDTTLRTALRAYDDDVLGRLALAARYDDVVAAYAHCAVDERPSAIAFVVAAINARCGFAGTAVSPASLRRALARPPSERESLGRDALADEALARSLADAYHRLARGARHARALVGEGEVFAIDHVAVVRQLAGRMTLAHVTDAALAIERALPRRVAPKRLARGSEATHLPDDTLYPAGGFAAISPGGDGANLENLVASELAYMEDGAGPDAFTVRYVEGELLFYTRDDSVFRRHRQVVAIVLAADLAHARVKQRELPWQQLVIALGLVVATVRWLADQLGDRALAIEVCMPPRAFADERAVLELLLEAEIARGAVRIVEQPATEALASAAAAAATAIADAIIVSHHGRLDAPSGLRAHHLEIGELDAWPRWCEVAEDVLRRLV